jgi:hypothetical protein
LKIGII